MKYADIANLKPADLEKKRAEAEEELIKLRAQVATGTAPKNPGLIKEYKKIIARIETLKNKQSREQPTEDKQQDA